jgi:hypothetical protein
MKTLRETLKNLYLDYVNNYLTSSKFALDNDLPTRDMAVLIVMGHRYHDEDATV